jgi:hypothetical protein
MAAKGMPSELQMAEEARPTVPSWQELAKALALRAEFRGKRKAMRPQRPRLLHRKGI